VHYSVRTPAPPVRKRSPVVKALITLLSAILLFYALATIMIIPAGQSPGQKYNVLLLGVDERKGDRGRSDTMMVMSIDYVSKQMRILSFPRDTRVQIAGHGFEKANAAYVFGGAPLASKTVSGLLGVPIHNYVVANFNSVVTIVDRLGGVTITVDKPMRYDDPYQNLHINIKAGTQLMNGKTALEYARWRGDAEGDISRTRRQQTLILAIVKKAAAPSSWPLLPSLLADFRSTITTDISAMRVPFLGAAMLLGVSRGVETKTLPGKASMVNGGSYWVTDPKEVKDVVQKFLGIK